MFTNATFAIITTPFIDFLHEIAEPGYGELPSLAYEGVAEGYVQVFDFNNDWCKGDIVTHADFFAILGATFDGMEPEEFSPFALTGPNYAMLAKIANSLEDAARGMRRQDMSMQIASHKETLEMRSADALAVLLEEPTYFERKQLQWLLDNPNAPFDEFLKSVDNNYDIATRYYRTEATSPDGYILKEQLRNKLQEWS